MILGTAIRDGAKWGDEAVDKHGGLSFLRHDNVRDALCSYFQ